MSEILLLDKIFHELKTSNTPPMAVHVSGTVTYVVYGATTVPQGNSTGTGYPVLRITEPSANQVYIDKGFLLESNRVAGSNGAAADTNLKTDLGNSLLLLADPLVIYG